MTVVKSPLGGQILDERTAKAHVYHLAAPANAEHGQISLHKKREHVHFQLVPLANGGVAGLQPVLPVKGGREVAAAGKDEAVDLHRFAKQLVQAQLFVVEGAHLGTRALDEALDIWIYV